jgi:hypothetical protein
MSKVKIIEQIIFDTLTANKESRDDDMLLISVIWASEIDCNNLSAHQLLKHIASGDLSHPESIMRSRRKVQEVHANLRGTNYEARHNNQKKIKTELGY